MTALGWTILGMALVTALTRYPLLAFVGRVTLSPSLVRALQFVPVAVLTAIITPMMFFPAGDRDGSQAFISCSAARLPRSSSWRTRNLIFTVLAGTGVVILLKLLCQ